jgi:peptide chain release factor 2
VFLFDLSKLTEKKEKLHKKMQEKDFWDDPEKAKNISTKANLIDTKIKKYNDIKNNIEDLEVLLQLTEEENDSSQIKELANMVYSLEKKIEEFRLETLLSGEYDSNNCMLSIHAGAGGTEAQDWTDMLLRMYTRWAENKNYKVEILDYLSGNEAGVKSVTLLIKGENAYGYLKAEKGVHRLVRISPFDSSNRRHTSFASVDVVPELDEIPDIEIDPSNLKIDTYRASGAGGQHVNTTDSAVRITHIPTGVVVTCQNERSQIKNRETAMKMLMAKLIEIKEEEQKEKIDDIQGDYGQISWGSQIRSYVFHPYNMVKDHRTNVETGNVQSVMDGNIDLFINEYLVQKKKQDK